VKRGFQYKGAGEKQNKPHMGTCKATGSGQGGLGSRGSSRPAVFQHPYLDQEIWGRTIGEEAYEAGTYSLPFQV